MEHGLESLSQTLSSGLHVQSSCPRQWLNDAEACSNAVQHRRITRRCNCTSYGSIVGAKAEETQQYWSGSRLADCLKALLNGSQQVSRGTGSGSTSPRLKQMNPILVDRQQAV